MARIAFTATNADAPPRRCPVCHETLDAYTSISVDPADPCPTMKPDDVTRCASCAVVLVVTTIGFRLATDDDLARLDPDLLPILTEDFPPWR